jgi:hypothetical protein
VRGLPVASLPFRWAAQKNNVCFCPELISFEIAIYRAENRNFKTRKQRTALSSGKSFAFAFAFGVWFDGRLIAEVGSARSVEKIHVNQKN